MTPASSDDSSFSSHSRLATSRWFVGSSSSSRSGSPPSARASDARVSSPPENVSSSAVEVRLAEAEAARDGADALAPGVAAGVLEPRLRLRVAAQRLRAVLARRHRLLQLPQLLLDRDEIGGAGEDVVAQRQAPLQRRALVVERDARALRERELAAVHLALAGEHAQQRRLAGAVRPGQRDALAPLDLEGNPVEKDVSGKLFSEIGGNDDGHAQRLER